MPCADVAIGGVQGVLCKIDVGFSDESMGAALVSLVAVGAMVKL